MGAGTFFETECSVRIEVFGYAFMTWNGMIEELHGSPLYQSIYHKISLALKLGESWDLSRDLDTVLVPQKLPIRKLGLSKCSRPLITELQNRDETETDS